MRRVVVTGSECTGKTTLAGALAEHYRTVSIPEYAREFVRTKGAPPEQADVESIARGQVNLEAEGAGRGPDLIIQDTDLLSTVIYSRHYYGSYPGWIEDTLRQHPPDLYLLAGIDVPWAADGEQRDRGHMREEMQELFRQALVEGKRRFVAVSGPHDRRMRIARSAIE